MLRKIRGLYIDTTEVAAIDIMLTNNGECMPIIILKSGHTIVTPNSYPVESAEAALDLVAREIEVVH